jgi:hypothetical protein
MRIDAYKTKFTYLKMPLAEGHPSESRSEAADTEDAAELGLAPASFPVPGTVHSVRNTHATQHSIQSNASRL